MAALRGHVAAGRGISSISVAELSFDVAKSGSARNLQAVTQFLEPLEIADFDRAAAQVCVPLRARLEAASTPIGPLDTQIAAHALALGVTLVSSKTREFARIPGLLPDNLVAAG